VHAIFVLSIGPIALLCVLSGINMVDPVPQLPDPAIFIWEHVMMIYSIGEPESLLVQQGVVIHCNPLSAFNAISTDVGHCRFYMDSDSDAATTKEARHSDKSQTRVL
jgi:hypothetical protein